jgi:hypothetical protein
MPTCPSVDESRGRLHKAGWSVGEVAGLLWYVSGSNGENTLSASATTQTEAWWRACVQAREVGMLAKARAKSADSGRGL